MQVILREHNGAIFRRCEPSDLIGVMEINMKTLPEHYSDYFYESLLAEAPEAFLVAEKNSQYVGYIMCKTEFGFSNFKKLGFVKKGHVVSVAVLDEHRGNGLFLVKANKLVFCLNKIFKQSQLVHLMNYWHMLPVYMLLLEIVLVLKQILEFAVVPMRK